MNDVDRFLQAIRESPADDDLRLVFADWLEDQGDPRGQLMRDLKRLPNLTAIDLSHNHLGPELAEAVLQLPQLPFLVELCLWQNALGDDGFIALVLHGEFERLIALDLSSNQLSWIGTEL